MEDQIPIRPDISMDLETGCGLPSNGEKARLIIGTAG